MCSVIFYIKRNILFFSQKQLDIIVSMRYNLIIV